MIHSNELKCIKQELRNLEDQKQWYAACAYVYNRWKHDKYNDLLCALLIGECAIISFYQSYEDVPFLLTPIEMTTIEQMLADAFDFGCKHFNSSFTFCWYTGYLFSKYTESFLVVNLPPEVVYNYHNILFERSIHLNPTHPFTLLLSAKDYSLFKTAEFRQSLLNCLKPYYMSNIIIDKELIEHIERCFKINILSEVISN